ncbi:putative amidohydrolase [Kribbella sp. VKM Ac-2569]|uniref:deaminated glutathione amidase n=1 Tax=Kribbella sp. VKM Ac-2569 TaxID=2512220 RepID=UPI0010F40662|nr:deaminated glutathione amidase [Kribbella sp. VKM Ac-2569]RZT17557.1 putative amidohydrolase [Kribbella sp. VKM Ac-2569]
MSTLNVSAAQFVASVDWQENLDTATQLIKQTDADGVDLLVLPEGVLARFIEERERIREYAQPLDGPFVTGLLKATEGLQLTVVVGIHEKSANDKPYNTLVVLKDGAITGLYRKLHLYDAFSQLESDNVTPADVVPELIDVNGFKVGLMTCYDVRFPELSRLLALDGADVLVLPAAWVKGPLKEHHWQTLVTARALENTVYVVASGECGQRNIGQSLIVDPLGVPLAQAAEEPATITAVVSRQRLTDARRRLPVLINRRFSVSPTPRPVEAVPTS